MCVWLYFFDTFMRLIFGGYTKLVSLKTLTGKNHPQIKFHRLWKVWTVLYGNHAFSILVLSTKKLYFSFLKKVFILWKICFKVKILKTFKISTDCLCRSDLSNRDYFENPYYCFLEEPMLFLLTLKWNL